MRIRSRRLRGRARHLTSNALGAGLCLLASAVPESASAQEIVRLRNDPRCEACRIEVTPGVTLGDRDGPGIIEQLASHAVRDSRGRFVVLSSYATQLKVFDANGKFVRTVGRKGAGPGEFEDVAAIQILAGDTLFAFEWGTSRWSQFSPDFDFLRSGPLPFQPQSGPIVLSTGDFVLNATRRTPDEIGQPLHLISRDGRLVRSFGSPSGVYRPDVPSLMSRATSPSTGALLWSAYRRKYQIDLIDASEGSIVKSLVREADWFPDGMKPEPRSAASDPTPEPRIMSVQEEAGLLWVLIGVADDDWRAQVRPPTPGEHYQIIDAQGYRDTVIEVIDPSRAVVMASVRIPQDVGQFIGPGMIGTVIEDEEGYPFLHTWSVRLQGRP